MGTVRASREIAMASGSKQRRVRRANAAAHAEADRRRRARADSLKCDKAVAALPDDARTGHRRQRLEHVGKLFASQAGRQVTHKERAFGCAAAVAVRAGARWAGRR
eukprot:242006-Chlamydomonas_euryale.AAC.1